MKTKTRFFFIAILVSFFFFSCDSMLFTGYTGQQGIKGERGEQGDKGPDGDPGEGISVETDEPDLTDYSAFISLTGKRNEMYYLEPDPVNLGKNLTLSAQGEFKQYFESSQLDSFSIIVGSEVTFKNQVTLSGIPILNLLNSAISVSASFVNNTYCAIWFIYTPVVGPGYYYRVSDTISIFPPTTVFAVTPNANDYKKNTYTILKEFAIDENNLELPKTDNYSSTLKVDHDVTFSVNISKALLESFISDSDIRNFEKSIDPQKYNGAVWGLTTRMGRDLVPSATTNEKHKLTSLNFYQYKSFAIQYPKETSVNSIVPFPIVESFALDINTNTINVTLKEYDTPYEGQVLTYILAKDGKTCIKTLEIK